MVAHLLWGYIIVSAGVILYVAGFAISLGFQTRRKEANRDRIKQMIQEDRVPPKLHQTFQLVCFDEALKDLQTEGELSPHYLPRVEGTFTSLVDRYKGKTTEERAYFAQVVTRYTGSFSKRELYQSLLTFLEKPNMYVTENVLQALYLHGDVTLIQIAYQKLSDARRFHHPKLIADGLATVSSDQEELAQKMWKDATSYQPSIQLGIVSFIARASSSFQETFLQFLQSEEGSLDMRLEMMRYFRKYPYEPAYPYLMELLNPDNGLAAEYRIVAASVLSAYPKPSTIAALKQAMKDREWYVRVNASQTLNDLNVPVEELTSIVTGDDRYASEMAAYRLMERSAEPNVN
ncbi:HEAT repeat domain-containing protein [Jeotgalibaca caeni]|uniref:HEAT repeat domain-containing protein n=1 Tax=Jeotgalibaca caeni TaxID=3028623 RepID=UPI00237D87CC|nr:HEAT repeat domain-containing protein [Jeotgalibaca caeni]MDE1549292.1 HEAT repeat domain-containing protein [Jeotgalibaca caeni]